MSEVCDELRTLVGDDVVGETVEFPDIMEEKAGSLFGGDRGGCRNEVCSFSYGVDNIHDCVMSVGFWEFDNEVYTDGVPALRRSFQWV